MNETVPLNTDLTLFSTSGCHLCEDAEALLTAALADGSGRAWRVVDIADDDVLLGRYGWHIPVLRRGDGEELRWPFDHQRLREFLRF